MNAVPMIVACCLGQGCDLPPAWHGFVDEYPPPGRRPVPDYHESTVLDDQERH